MDTFKDSSSTMITAGAAIIGTIASSAYFYSQNKILYDQLENMQKRLDVMEEQLANTIKRQQAFLNSQKNIASTLHLTSDATKRLNYDLITARNEIDRVYEQVDSVEGTVEDFSKKLKAKGIEVEIQKTQKNKRSSTRRSTPRRQPRPPMASQMQMPVQIPVQTQIQWDSNNTNDDDINAFLNNF